MYNRYIKRVLDILLSFLLLPLLVIISIPIGFLIKLDDGGQIFYCGERLGKDLQVFMMYKFRTMKVDAPDIRNRDGSTVNSENDPRLTRIGKILRKTSIDEVPQIINILKGEMSLIGPRPSPLGNIHNYSPKYLQKFSIRPGITGYNQVKFRNNATQEQREENDCYYLENMNFLLDFKIFFITILNIIKLQNVYRNNEG